MHEGSASTEEHATEKTVQTFALMPRKEKKTEERGKDKKPTKGSVSTEEYTMEETNMQACEVIPSRGKQAGRDDSKKKASFFTEGCTSTEENMHARQGIQSKAQKTKKIGKDKRPKKVSLPSGAHTTSLTVELQVPGPSAEPSHIKIKEEKNVSEGLLSSSKKKLFQSRKTSHQASPSSEKKISVMDQKMIHCPMVQQKISQKKNTVITEAKIDFVKGTQAFQENQRQRTKKPEKESSLKKVSEFPEKKTHPVKEEAKSEANSKRHETEAILNKVERVKLKRKVTQLKMKFILQLHKNKKHQKEKEKLQAENRKFMEKYQQLEAKNQELANWTDGFHRQVSKQVEQLQESEEKIDGATNIIDVTLNEIPQIEDLPRYIKEIITQILYDIRDVLTGHREVEVMEQLE